MFKKYQLRSYNFRLVILLIVTSVYGIAVINSADSSYTIKQCAGLLLSLFVMVVVSLIDYNWLLRFYWIMYALNFVLLVLVLALGSESKGAQRWINIGGFRFQQKVCIHKAGHVKFSFGISFSTKGIPFWFFLHSFYHMANFPIRQPWIFLFHDDCMSK